MNKLLLRNKIKGKKFLVTGCAGFIGSHLTDALIQNGAIVYGIDNLDTGSKENIKHLLNNPKFIFTKEDICNENIMRKLVSQVEFVFHGAVRSIGGSTDNPMRDLRVNIEGTLILLELIKKSKIKRLIFASSASVYGNAKHFPEKETDPVDPLSPYGVSKLAAEKYCINYHRLYNLPITCLRYFNVYGPRQRWDSYYGGVVSIFINQALNQKSLSVYGNGNQTRDFTYIKDAVEATIRALFAKKIEGKVINISNGKEYSINYLAKMVKKISNNNIQIQYAKDRLVDNVKRRIGDNKLAKKILKFSPRVKLEDGLLKTYYWHKENPIK